MHVCTAHLPCQRRLHPGLCCYYTPGTWYYSFASIGCEPFAVNTNLVRWVCGIPTAKPSADERAEQMCSTPAQYLVSVQGVLA